MFLDQRHGWMEQARFGLQTAAYPVQLAVSSPTTAWGWVQQNFESREALRAENERLSGILASKGIAHILDIWGDGAGHDWPWWQAMVVKFL